MVSIISVYGGNMITKRQRNTLMRLIENVLVSEAQYEVFSHMRKFDNSEDPSVRELITMNLERSMKNCDETGKALLGFLDEITEKTDETN